MIKQIWFVKNERKLINYLCIIIALFVLLYAILSAWGIVNLVWLDIFLEGQIIVLPLFTCLLSILLYWLSNHTKASKGCTDDNAKALQKQFKRDILIGTNLMLTLAFAFVSLDIISKAKAVESFGLFPTYLCLIGGVIFYIIKIKSIFSINDKKEN